MKQLFITIFCLISITEGFSQDINQTLQLADRYYKDGQYELAVRYYRRVAFFGDDSTQSRIFPLIAHCYLITGEYKESIFFYDLASNTVTNDSLYNEYAFSRVLCNILQNNFDYALQDLYSISDTNSLYFNRKYHFYMGIICLKSNDFPLSQDHFIRSAKNNLISEQIQKLFKEVNPKKPNPKTAKILSIILPGLGQLYSGDLFNAFNSFTLNTTLVVLAVSVAINYSLADAFLSVLPWLQRYYMGGYTRAELIAENKRKEKYNMLLNQIFQIQEE